MRRFFINKNDIKNNGLTITGTEAHHIKDVIRLNTNDEFIGFDGKGYNYMCKISKMSKDKIIVSIEKKEKSKIIIPNITLACAVPKHQKMDFIVQKASELRVKTLIPIQTARTDVKLDEKKREKKHARWSQIAKESSKQCGRDDILKVAELMQFKDVIKNSSNHGVKLIPCLCEKTKPIKHVLRRINPSSALILIGPEGDFTPCEIDTAIKSDFVPISLGPVVLRVDTAAIFTISSVIYEFFSK